MKYQNPIIRGFNPDPSICRVGGDYYLVTSTFEFFPGIPVYHSRDLVNWRQIGSCIDRPEQLPMVQAAAGMGIWAPTIRHDGRRFYVTAKCKELGNFIVSAEDPAGPWSQPVTVDITGIDPSILFEDGKAYYCTNHTPEGMKSAISLVEVNPDTGEMLSPIRPLWSGMSHWPRQCLEAPHIYHIGGWYYLLAAEGGTGYEHTITCARSRNIWGPYEDAPGYLLSNVPVGDTGVACSGHGDLVQAEDGSWWCVHLATRPDDEWYSHLGRESFLLPVTWQDEWPVIADGRCRIDCEGSLWAAQKPIPVWTADLSRIEPPWLFVRQPAEENYAASPQGMTLTPTPVRLSDGTGSPTLMAVRQGDIDCTVEAVLTFQPQQDGDEAGMTIYISCDGFYTFSRVREAGQDLIVIAKSSPDFVPIRMPVQGDRISYRIDASKREYALSFAVDGGEYVRAGTVPVLTRADAGKCFTGTLIGVYAQCAAQTEARAKLCRFCMETA